MTYRAFYAMKAQPPCTKYALIFLPASEDSDFPAYPHSIFGNNYTWVVLNTRLSLTPLLGILLSIKGSVFFYRRPVTPVIFPPVFTT